MAAAEERFLSTEEVADRFQVDEQTVRRWIKSGKLEAFKPGREWRIPPAALETLVESYSSPKEQSPLPDFLAPISQEDLSEEERAALDRVVAGETPEAVFAGDAGQATLRIMSALVTEMGRLAEENSRYAEENVMLRRLVGARE